jgi:hypothetical protein
MSPWQRIMTLARTERPRPSDGHTAQEEEVYRAGLAPAGAPIKEWEWGL